MRSLNLNRSLLASALISWIAPHLWGCGPAPSTGSASAPKAAPVAKEVSSLRTFFVGASAPELNDAVRSALVASGYTLVTSQREPHHLTATVTATFAAEPSLFAVTVNGVQRTNIRFNVSLVMAVASDKRIVDNASVQFVAPREEVSAEKVQPLISSLASSGRVAQYAREVESKQRAEANAKADAEERARQEKGDAERRRLDEQHQADEAAWKDAGSDDCAGPTKPDSCRTLAAWVKAHPKNPHLNEANDIIKKSAERIASLTEEALWKDANVDQCKAPKEGDDCLGVEVYIGKYPTGAHAAEAKEALSKSANKIATLQKAEAQRAETEKKKQEKGECRDECKNNRCAAYALSNKYDLCMSRCLRNICGQ